jgi:hypothetical protein
VTAYVVRRGGTVVATVPRTPFVDTALTPQTAYAYTVTAVDAAGNTGPTSAPASVTTPVAPTGTGGTSTFTPVADSYVDDSQPSVNFGTATQLRVDGSPVVRSYLRFDPEGLGGSVTSAVLRIWANSAQSTGYRVQAVASTTWGETTITSANAPAMSATVTGSSGSVATGTWTQVDVTPLVTGAGPVSFGLTTTSSTALSLASRESANAPQLVVTTVGGNDTAAPTQPGGVTATGIGPSQVRVAWTASTDNIGVTAYRVFRDGVQAGTAAGTATSLVDDGLAVQSTHTYTVQAVDRSGNLSALSAPATAQTPTTPQVPCLARSSAPARFAHVVWIWMENKPLSSIIGSSSAPYMNSLATDCSLATNYVAITHPSLPNYIAATSGSTQGITDDNPPSSHPLTAPSIYSQVEAAGGTWRDYAESSPANCTLTDSGLYAVRHVPSTYYTGIRTTCKVWNVPLGAPTAGRMVSEIQAGALPSFSFVTPNLCNDMHGASGCPSDLIATGDKWLSQVLPAIFAGPNYRNGDTLVILTFDEGSGSDNRVATWVMSPYTTPETRSNTAFTHYSLLKTTEQALGITTLLGGAGDPGTASMRADFGLGG